jgi:hypothetical protein
MVPEEDSIQNYNYLKSVYFINLIMIYAPKYAPTQSMLAWILGIPKTFFRAVYNTCGLQSVSDLIVSKIAASPYGPASDMYKVVLGDIAAEE